MQRTFQYTIDSIHQGLTLRRYLSGEGYSHHIFVGMKALKDPVLVNGKHAFLTDHVKTGDILTVTLPDETTSEMIVPTNIPLNIVYEDDDIILINKSSDLPIHPSRGNFDNTLANGLVYYFNEKQEPFVYRCINRLDKDTSGLLIVAKHALSAAILSQAMRERQIQRTYLALVEGRPDSEGTIDLPIGRKDASIIERQVDLSHGERAVTHFSVLKYYSGYSLVELHLETGRTHQIRVHMTAIGHPLLGDSLYNPAYFAENAPFPMKRQALHSASLTFTHPIKKEAMHITAPLPDDMLYFLK